MLSFAVDTVVPVALPGITRSVRLTRGELDDMLRPAIGETVAATRRVLDAAGVEAGDLAAILLVGGSSRIPLVSEMLSAAFGRPLALDNHPKHDVALGAAIRDTPATQPAVPATAVVTPPAPADVAGTTPTVARPDTDVTSSGASSADRPAGATRGPGPAGRRRTGVRPRSSARCTPSRKAVDRPPLRRRGVDDSYGHRRCSSSPCS